MRHGTLYDELGVPRDAGPSDLKAAYRRLAKRLHPDTGASPDAADQLARVNRAWGCSPTRSAAPPMTVRCRADRLRRARQRAGPRRRRATAAMPAPPAGAPPPCRGVVRRDPPPGRPGRRRGGHSAALALSLRRRGRRRNVYEAELDALMASRHRRHRDEGRDARALGVSPLDLPLGAALLGLRSHARVLLRYQLAERPPLRVAVQAELVDRMWDNLAHGLSHEVEAALGGNPHVARRLNLTEPARSPSPPGSLRSLDRPGRGLIAALPEPARDQEAVTAASIRSMPVTSAAAPWSSRAAKAPWRMASVAAPRLVVAGPVGVADLEVGGLPTEHLGILLAALDLVGQPDVEPDRPHCEEVGAAPELAQHRDEVHRPAGWVVGCGLAPDAGVEVSPAGSAWSSTVSAARLNSSRPSTSAACPAEVGARLEVEPSRLLRRRLLPGRRPDLLDEAGHEVPAERRLHDERLHVTEHPAPPEEVQPEAVEAQRLALRQRVRREVERRAERDPAAHRTHHLCRVHCATPHVRGHTPSATAEDKRTATVRRKPRRGEPMFRPCCSRRTTTATSATGSPN